MNLKIRIIFLFVLTYLIAIASFTYLLSCLWLPVPSSMFNNWLFNPLIRNGLIVAGSGLLVALSLGLLTGYWLSKPFKQLTKAMELISSGNLSKELTIKGIKEVKKLFISYNQMLDYLKQSQEVLKRHQYRAGWQEAAVALAYEIHNPLLLIRPSLDKISQKAIRCQQEIEIIDQEIEGLKELANNLLNLGLPHELNLLPKPIMPIVMNSLSACQVHQKAKLKLEYKKGNIYVMADEEALKKAFIHLIKNSLEAMTGSGNLKIRISNEDAQDIMIEFIDSGCGIESDSLDSIFEPHYSKKREGVGLGLPISQKIISGHGGRIEVESKPGKGSNFKVILPSLTEA